MRLSDRIVSIIQQAILESFGKVHVYLFGSRVDDVKLGGDIDLAIDIELSANEFQKKKILFLTYMVKYNFDLKIDLVQYNTKDQLLFKEIHNNNVQLF